MHWRPPTIDWFRSEPRLQLCGRGQCTVALCSWPIAEEVFKATVRVQEGDEEEETDKLVQQVFLEIGINAADGMVSAPQAAKAPAQQEAAPEAEPMAQGADGGGGGGGGSGVDAELEARLNALRGK